jgi:hypothetical protein
MTITEKDLAEWQAVTDAATPGPWELAERDDARAQLAQAVEALRTVSKHIPTCKIEVGHGLEPRCALCAFWAGSGWSSQPCSGAYS